MKYNYLYKYYPIVDYALISLQKEEICFNSMESFEDKNEGQYIMKSREEDDGDLSKNIAARISEDYTEGIRFHNRVLSLTDRKDNKYMWDEYAKGGTGFCIEYSFDELMGMDASIKNIQYQNEIGTHSFLQDDINEEKFHGYLGNILFTKSSKYKPESEIRLVCSVPDTMITEIDMYEYLSNKDESFIYYYNSAIRMHYKAPKRIMKKCVPHKIYLGYNISQEDEEIIRKMVEGKYPIEKIRKESLVNE